MTDAQAIALGIFELLEHILKHVDWRTLLFAQSVSQHWRNCIASSIPVQQKLGLHALHKRREYWAVQKNAIEMLVSARRIEPSDLVHKVPNEIILEKARPTDGLRMFATAGLGNPLGPNFGTELMFKWQSIPESLLRDESEASWRHMQCMQPPVLKLMGCTTLFYRDALMFRRIPGHRAVEVIENHEGITLGHLIDIAKQWKAEAPAGVDWYTELFSFTAVGVIVQEEFFSRLAK